MSFNQKVIALALLILLAVPGGYFFYRLNRRTHRPTPPPAREEVVVTIIPGWNLRDVASYLVSLGLASTTDDVYGFTGKPATVPVASKIERLSYEGYLAPETYRVFRDARLGDIIQKFEDQRNKEMDRLFPVSDYSHDRPDNMWSMLTMASLLEKEARTPEDRRLVSDILWRRIDKNWALQLDSTVHYALDITGNVFTTDKQRADKSPFNTYLNVGLPPGPICNPSLDSIDAALNPTKNDYWYFLTGNDGQMHYAKTLDEHNANRYKYLR